MSTNRIRPIAIGIFRQDDRLFVAEGSDPATGRRFYRPLGGGIEFGERGHETLVREMREEIGAEITAVRYLCTIENIFTYDGGTGHEIVQVYAARFSDPAFYANAVCAGSEAFATDGPLQFQAVWHLLTDFGPDAPLYPAELLDLLVQERNP
ncbi:MAG: NUDIX hydrolase [Chloroflexota bacterium]|nr:NUDIX hydrolase [Chloroflexota bacterium]